VQLKLAAGENLGMNGLGQHCFLVVLIRDKHLSMLRNCLNGCAFTWWVMTSGEWFASSLLYIPMSACISSLILSGGQ
jgi:hypothetical protein